MRTEKFWAILICCVYLNTYHFTLLYVFLELLLSVLRCWNRLPLFLLVEATTSLLQQSNLVANAQQSPAHYQCSHFACISCHDGSRYVNNIVWH